MSIFRSKSVHVDVLASGRTGDLTPSNLAHLQTQPQSQTRNLRRIKYRAGNYFNPVPSSEAIIQPGRPIPSGAIPMFSGGAQSFALLLFVQAKPGSKKKSTRPESFASIHGTTGLRQMIGEQCVFPAMGSYCSLAYSALACFRIGMSGSASFHRLKKS